MLKNNVGVMGWDLTQKLTQKLTPRDPEKLRHFWMSAVNVWMLVSNQYVNVKFNADTYGEMKKFMHDLVM